MQRSLFHALILGSLMVVAVGCGGGSAGSPVVEDIDALIAATGTGEFAALVAEGDAAWERRGDRAGTEAAIAAWEAAIHAPTGANVNRRLAMTPVFVKLSQGYYWLAHAHLRFDETATDDDMLATYERGMDYGAQAIALRNDDWRRALLYETPIPEAANLLTVDDVPAVYWHATNLGRWGLVRGIATVLSRVSDIKAMMDRVEALAPEFYYNATNRYFGVYYTKLPFGNPDLDQARRRLEACIAAHPEYLETRVLLADDWAIVAQDRAVAEQQLQFVLDADPTVDPALEPENRNAQRRAALLLGELDENFR
ncbi:MAG: hypothetical protein H6700_11290 [Myxococcales bacterium]|nr:hypothetical protein [Myxococcales bacterium]MCB9532341.1 hypothetical protein [Myxococcales bacterium]